MSEGRDGWISCDDELPQDGVLVDTIIDDAKAGPRNEQQLKRHGRLWFVPDGSIYVYYSPTHWRVPREQPAPLSDNGSGSSGDSR